MSFMYFVASTSRTTPTCLAYAFDGKQPTVRDIIGAGPGGNPGKLFGAGRWLHDGTGLGYFPDRQTWIGPTPDGVWIGYANDAPPKPEELARETQLRGHQVRLADGQQWEIPVARAFDEGRWTSKLPQKLIYDITTGQWTYAGVEARYTRLWEVANRWWDAFVVKSEAVEAQMSNHDAIECAVDAIGFNYCIGRVEASMLGLLTDSIIAEVLNAVVDIPTLEAWSKKNAQHVA
jgi:hypothetical protein